jgi:amino acid transporter
MDTFYKLLSYVFNPAPGRSFGYYIVFGIIAGLCLALAIFLKIYIKKNKEDKAFRRIFKRFPTRLTYLSVILAAYLFFRYYAVPFLSMRFLLYVILASIIYLFYLLINSYLNKYPLEKKNHEELIAKNKYLPGKHKKK